MDLAAPDRGRTGCPSGRIDRWTAGIDPFLPFKFGPAAEAGARRWKKEGFRQRRRRLRGPARAGGRVFTTFDWKAEKIAQATRGAVSLLGKD